MEEANIRKKEIAREMEEKTAGFDLRLEKEISEKLDAFRSQMEADMQNRLSEQKSDAEEQLRQMEENYEACHGQYIEELFKAITEG